MTVLLQCYNPRGYRFSMPSASASTSQTALLREKFWPHELLLGLLPLLIAVELLVWIAYLPLTMKGIADFRSMDAGAYMVRTGQGRDLFDYSKQQQIELKILPDGVRFFLRMNHPAYEELLYVPFSMLPYRTGFVLFLALNIGVALLCIVLLQPYLGPLAERWVLFPALLFPSFFPITRALAQGQDSILLLAFLAGAMVYLDKGKDLNAGCLIGLGLFKFQIVLAIALIFFLWKRWRFVAGFAISASICMAISLLMVGVHGFVQYAAMLTSMKLTSHIMLNLRGLLSAVLETHIGLIWLAVVIGLSSVVVLWLTTRARPSLPLAVLAASLVSYHLIAHDASLLIIPIAVALCERTLWMSLAAIFTLVGPLVALWPDYAYLGAIPILLLFAAFIRREDVAGRVASGAVPV